MRNLVEHNAMEIVSFSIHAPTLGASVAEAIFLAELNSVSVRGPASRVGTMRLVRYKGDTLTIITTRTLEYKPVRMRCLPLCRSTKNTDTTLTSTAVTG